VAIAATSGERQRRAAGAGEQVAGERAALPGNAGYMFVIFLQRARDTDWETGSVFFSFDVASTTPMDGVRWLPSIVRTPGGGP
jgi:hypothetical protein